MKKILFVCHGNICRSPMAEYLFRALAALRGVGAAFQVASCATSTEEIRNGRGNPVYPPAAAELRRHGIDCAGKHAVQLKKADYDAYDLLIAMDETNLRNMQRMCGGDPQHKMHLLLDYAGRGGSVADPWYTGAFDVAYRDIYDGCTALLDALTPAAATQTDCPICGAPLQHLQEEVLLECSICRKKEPARSCCSAGHYVCDACRTQGMAAIVRLCELDPSTDPIAILRRLMALPTCHMHGPEHHVMVGAALLCAYHNAGGAVQLPEALRAMVTRGIQVPGGACGYWGACGAGISCGMALSIARGDSPMAGREWSLTQGLTAAALGNIATVGGPRCCKRDSYLAIEAAVDYVARTWGVHMAHTRPVCIHSAKNAQCLGAACPFFPGA